MSYTSTESDDRTWMSQKDQAESPSADEDNSGVSFSGGVSLKKGPWTSAEDAILVEYVKKHGEGNWNAVQKHSGLSRCGKSCRLRWANHLRPNLKKGAFTPEEEQLIIELHARMGNKWARMAAHLPGRTDNEIKNYWNTRIKRCQRAGLPLYPPNICFETMNENQSQNGNEFTVGDKRNNDHLQPSGYDIPDVIFDNFKVNQGFSFMPLFPDLSVSSMLNQGLGSQSFGIVPPTLDCFKQLPISEPLFSTLHGGATCELPAFERFSSSEKIHWPLGVGFPYDPDPGSKNLVPLAGLASGSHTLTDGNFSTSQTLHVAAKLELPSLQYPETDLSSWLACSPTPPSEAVDAYVESPLTVSVQSDCSSPRNSGLLEALLHEAQAMGTGKNKLSEKTSNSSTVIPSDSVKNSSGFDLCYTEGDSVDPVSPLGLSSTSVSGTCTPLSVGSSLEDSSTGRISNGQTIKSEPAEHTASQNVAMEISPQLDFSRPDELLGSDWYANDSKNLSFSDAIANLLGEGICGEYRHVPTGPSSVLAQGLGGINSCPWSYMPPVCQMSEFP